MTIGSEIGTIACTFCRRNVYETEAVWSYRQPYHERCFRMMMANDIKRFERKSQLGSLTIAEANMLAELQHDLDIAERDVQQRPTQKGKNDFSTTGPAFIRRPEARIASGKAELADSMKKLEAAREERWVWEAYNQLEAHSKKLIEGDSNIQN